MLHRCRAAFLTLTLGSALALGCVRAGDAGEAEDDAAALDEANGGLTAADEAPAFGDEAVASTEDLDVTFADATADAETPAGAASYRVLVLWGHLPPARDTSDEEVAPSPIDWSGTVRVDEGAIGVHRTLRFEEHDGIQPRTAANEVAFVSHTLPAVDGMLLRVVVPASGAQVLRLSAAGLQADIDLADLAARGGDAIPLGDGRNGVALAAHRDAPGCAQGFVFGRWIKARADLGAFRGRVVSERGEPLGHVKGLWGHAPRRDEDVFFGKYIDIDGQFRGLFGGTYGDGVFEGRWGTKDPSRAGRIVGLYSDGPDQDDGRGFYVSRWAEACPAE